jgi:hypothetical protein
MSRAETAPIPSLGAPPPNYVGVAYRMHADFATHGNSVGNPDLNMTDVPQDAPESMLSITF